MMFLFADLSVKTLPLFNAPHPPLNPVFGYLSIQTGLMHNLRFCGNMRPPEDKDPTDITYYREFVPQDSMSELIKFLFPGHNGQLVTEAVNNPNSFGFRMKDPKKFCKYLDIIRPLRILIMQMPKNYLRADVLKKFFDNFHRWGLGLDEKKLSREQKDKREADFDTMNKYSEAFKTIGEKSEISFSADPLASLIVLALRDEYFHQTKPGSQHWGKSGTYPKGMAEQVLLAFLWRHGWDAPPDFSSARTDISREDAYVVDAYNDFFSKPTSQTFSGIHGQEPSMAEVEQKVRIDNEKTSGMITFLDKLHNWGITPYGFNPVPNGENGSARMYASGQEKQNLFPDCIETTLRHFIALVCYNHDISPHYNAIPTERLRDFFNSALNINFGDTQNRSRFNQFVADLNQNDGVFPIRYIKSSSVGGEKDNEVNTGFINFLNVLMKMLGLSNLKNRGESKTLQEEVQEFYIQTQTERETKPDKIEELFNKFLKTFDQGRTITIKTSKLARGLDYSGTAYDWYGNITVSIKYSNGNTVSFTLHQEKNHGAIRNIMDSTINDPSKKEQMQQEAQALQLPPYPAYGVFWLFCESLFKGQVSQIKHRLYKFYPNKPMEGADQCLHPLRVIENQPALFDKPLFRQSLKNIFDSLVFQDDGHVLHKVEQIISGVLKKDPNCFIKDITSIATASTKEELSRFNPANIKILYLKGENGFDALDLPKLQNLYVLGPSIMSFRPGPYFKFLKFTETGCIEILDLTDAKKLKELRFYGRQVESLTVGPYLNKLSILGFQASDVRATTTIDLSNARQLQDLYIWERLKNIKGLEGAEKLQYIDAPFYPLPHFAVGANLKKVNINIVGTLDVTNAKALQELTIKGDVQNDLDFTHAPQLQKLTLWGATIPSLKIGPNVQCLVLLHSTIGKIDLTQVQNLKKVAICHSTVNTPLDLTPAVQLKEFETKDENKIKGLKVGPNIKDICINGEIEYIDLSSATQLQKLGICGTIEGSIDLSLAEKLEEFYTTWGSTVSFLHVGQNLQQLRLSGTIIGDVDLTNVVPLKELDLWCQISGELKLGNNPNLIKIYDTSKSFRSVDIGSFAPSPNLKIIGKGPLAQAVRAKLGHKD